MAETLVKLRVDNKEYDAKIESARRGLLAMEQACRKVGGTFEFVEKEELAFVKALGQMETVSSTTKGKLRELSNTIMDLTTMYGGLTEEEKKSEFGKAMASSIDQLKSRAGGLKDQMDDLQAELKNIASDTSFTDGVNLMANTVGKCSAAMVAWGGDSKSMEEVIKSLAKIQTSVAAVEALTKAFQKQNLVLLKNPLVLFTAAVVAAAAAINKLTKGTEDAARSEEQLARNAEYCAEAIKGINDQCDFDVAIAEACGKSKKQILLLRQAAAEAAEELAYSNLMASGKAYDHNSQEYKAWRDAAENKQKVTNEVILNDYIERNGLNKKSVRGATQTFSNGLKVQAEEDWDTIREFKQKPFEIKSIIADEKALEKSVNDTMKNIKLEPLPVELDVNEAIKSWKKLNKEQNLEKMYQTASGLSDVFGAAGNALGQFAEESEAAAAAQKAFTIASAVAQLVGQFAATHKGVDIWSWIAGTIAGVGTLTAAIASIKSSTSSYAEGGVVGGSTYVGDRVPALLNAGEVVLSAAATSNLASNLQSQQATAQRPYVTGREIYLGLNNHLKATGQGSLVTTRS